MWMKGFTSRLWLRIILIVLAVLLVTFICLYLCYFNGGISTEHRQWSEFGDYIAGIAGVLNVLAFAGLTVTIHLINKADSAKSTRFHAEELVIKKVQNYIDTLDALYLTFQKAVITTKDIAKARAIANETFEVLQPLMTYLYYLKKFDFLPDTTIELIINFHEYLFTASDKFLCYELEIDGEDGKPVEVKDVLKAYRYIYKFLEGLDVKMTADIADFEMTKEDITNYGEEHPDKIEQKEN